ncbi:hypothetical protein LTS17_010230 [Exophiala oligosperma]
MASTIGKTAIVTGGAGSFGKLLCYEFARAGANVVVNDLGGSVSGLGASAGPAEEIAEAIRKEGYSAVADTHSVMDAEKIIDTALKAFGRVDILINNAGIATFGAYETQDPEALRRVLEVNAVGPLLLCRFALPLFKAQNYGRIVNISSASMLGMAGLGAYPASKAALVGLTRSLALEVQDQNIRVNAVGPVAVSRMAQDYQADPDRDERLEAQAQWPPESNLAPILALASEPHDFNGQFFNTANYQTCRVVVGAKPAMRIDSVKGFLDAKEQLMGQTVPTKDFDSGGALLAWSRPQ